MFIRIVVLFTIIVGRQMIFFSYKIDNYSDFVSYFYNKKLIKTSNSLFKIIEIINSVTINIANMRSLDLVSYLIFLS